MVFRLRENATNTRLKGNQLFRVLRNDLGLREISVLFFYGQIMVVTDELRIELFG